MTTWYVRPNTSHNTTRNGTSYATAWGGWSEIVWGASGVNAGDTLYLCGAHAYAASIAVGTHGATSNANRATIRGDYSASPGVISFSSVGWFDAGKSYTTLKAITFNGGAPGYQCIYLSASAGFVVDGCTFVGGYDGVTLASNVAFTSCSIINSTFYGQENAGINQSIAAASINSSGVIVTGNTVHDTSLYGIQLSISATNSAWTSSRLTNYTVSNNTIYNTPGPSIYLRTCNNDQVTAPTVYSSGLVASGNSVRNCGTVAGPNGNHGGIHVTGFSVPVITGNSVRDTYVTGAGIQTAKNLSPLITFNTISGIRSGTDTGNFQSGLPIDGNGIFFDNLTVGGLAFGNYISNLVSTGNPNSGTGMSFWTATGAKYIGNVVENCYVGASYGHGSETGNQVFNNTFINCTYGVVKIGTSALTGNITVKNNILHKCTTGFSIGTNPSITADYNNIFGHSTAYSGISAGANDKSVDPNLDSAYRPREPSVKSSGAPLGGIDFYGKEFKTVPNIGAVGSASAKTLSSRSIAARSVTTRNITTRRGVAV